MKPLTGTARFEKNSGPKASLSEDVTALPVFKTN